MISTPRIAAVCAAACGHAVATPPPFTDLSYTEARAAAGEREKLFVVDATAEWCGPCKRMDARVWVDEAVVSWFGEHAIASQVDVDEQRELAMELGIRAMPTIIAFRGEEELDRVVGYQSPAELISWLEGVEDGRSRLDRLRERVAADEDAGDFDVGSRHDLARALAEGGHDAEAVGHYVWLWEHALEHDPNYRGVRVSFMAAEMEALVRRGAGLGAFTGLRDRTEARLTGGAPTWDDLGDWIALNEIIGDEESTLAWIDRNIGDEAGRDTIRQFAHRVEPLLLARGRWADYGTLLVDPVEQIRGEHRQIDFIAGMLPEDTDPRELQRYRDEQTAVFRERAGTVHAGLLAAERRTEAWEAAKAALELDDSLETRRAIVSAAMRAGVAREMHRELADDDPDLLARLNGVLGDG